jgi:hypothetical protein
LSGQFRDGENLRRLLEQIACELHGEERESLKRYIVTSNHDSRITNHDSQIADHDSE